MEPEFSSLNDIILHAFQKHTRKVCFRIKPNQHFQNVTYRQFEIKVFRLVELFNQLGLQSGDRVVVAANNCLEWMVVSIATLLAGGAVTPLRPSIPRKAFQVVLENSGARLAFLDEARLLQEAISLIEDDAEVALKHVLVADLSLAEETHTVSLRQVLDNFRPLSPEAQQAIRAQAQQVAPSDLAVLQYRTDTSGYLRGAVFDHGRSLKTVQAITDWFPLYEDDVAFTMDPWTNTASMEVAFHYFAHGIPNVLSDNDDRVVHDNLKQTSPTVTLNIPYFFERMYAQMMESIQALSEDSQAVFHWAVAKGREYHTAGADASEALREEYKRADQTFFAQLRGEIGGRMRRMYSAGATLPKELQRFFEAIGLPVLNLYTLTQAGGFVTINYPDSYKSGSCGQVAPGFEVEISDDGEVLVRGETLMNKYWGDSPDGAVDPIDAEGWLHTGDIGYFDGEGFLYLTGRKQALEVLSIGRKVRPKLIEDALMESPLVAEAVVFAEGRPFPTAFIIPDLAEMSTQFQDQDDETLMINGDSPLTWFWAGEREDNQPMASPAHKSVKTSIDEIVEEVNSWLDRWERLRAYSLLDQAFSKAATEITELKQHSRHLIADKYTRQIDTMYPATTQIEEHEIDKVQVSPERMRELLEKANMLDAWMTDAGIGFLFKLASTKQIDVPSMVHISDTAATIAQMENEEIPLTTALIVGDPVRIARVLPQSEIQLLRHDHIRRMRHILFTLAKMVDGLVLGYVVDRYGYVRGVHKLKTSIEHHAPSFLGPQFRQHAAISKACNAVIFFVPTGGRQVRVFADGHLVGGYSNGDWAPESIQHIEQRVAQLAQEHQYNLALVQRLLTCAFRMSEDNMGAIFVLGNADRVLAGSDQSEVSHFALVESVPLTAITNSELITLAKQDGATVIDSNGDFRGCMVLLRPAADTPAEIGPGKGARHSSAAKMSAEAECMAITVSQDGPITVYHNGYRVLSL